MGKKQSWTYIYLDNCAWCDLAERRLKNGFTVTDEDIANLKGSRFLPVLSQFNIGESAREVILDLQCGRKTTPIMADLAKHRIYEWKSPFEHDIQHLRTGAQGKYPIQRLFMKRGGISAILDVLLNPAKNLQFFKTAHESTENLKDELMRASRGFIDTLSDKITKERGEGRQQTNIRDVLKDNNTFNVCQKYIWDFLPIIFPNDSGVVDVIKENMDTSKVIVSLAKCRVAVCSAYLGNGEKIRGNELVDALHYAMSGFCDFFITSDMDLFNILTERKGILHSITTLTLKSFIKKYLRGENTP